MEQNQEVNPNLRYTDGGKQSAGFWRSVIDSIQANDVVRRRLLAFFGFPMAWFFANNYVQAPRGFTQALFWPVFLLVTFWYFKPEIRYRDPIVILSALGVLAGSVHAALYASDEMSALNFMALPLLSVFCLITATRNHPEITARSFLSTLDTLLVKPVMSVFLVIPFLSRSKGEGGVKPKSDQRLIREVLIGLLLAIPLVFILLILLTRADSGFEGSVSGLFNGFLLNFRFTDLMGRLIVSCLALLYFLGVVIGVRLNRDQEAITIAAGRFQSATISLIILWSVNLLYFLFTLTQMQTLYFPREALDGMNLGIAQYARSGFFSLLQVLVINLFLLWYLSRFTKNSPRLALAMKTGYLFMTLFTINMIVSSFYKMNLYEAQYGYTYLRLFVKFALIFFSLGLALMAAFMLKKTREIIKPLTGLAIVLYMILSLLNVEGLIVTKAAEIYKGSGRLDIAYLSKLSADAFPAFRTAFDLDNTQDQPLLDLKSSYTDRLFRELDSDYRREHPLSVTLSELRIKP